jgi:HEAT repeat protein
VHTTARLFAAVLAVSVSTAALASSAPIALTGLKPATYLQRRNHRPDVTAEVRALPVDARLQLLNREGSWVTVDDARTAGLKPAALQQLRQQERYAVKAGAMLALAKEADPRITPAIRALLTDVDDSLAQIAAERLGERHDDATIVATLQALARNTSRSLDVRSGAIAGLGRQRTSEALSALIALVSSSTELQVAALIAINNLGSRWAFEARGDIEGGKALRAQAVAALSALSLKGDAEARRVIVVGHLRD